jgi:hypothetical protein
MPPSLLFRGCDDSFHDRLWQSAGFRCPHLRRGTGKSELGSTSQPRPHQKLGLGSRRLGHHGADRNSHGQKTAMLVP